MVLFYQDHGQHHGVFRNVLAVIFCAESKNEIGHGNPSELILSGWALMLGGRA